MEARLINGAYIFYEDGSVFKMPDSPESSDVEEDGVIFIERPVHPNHGWREISPEPSPDREIAEQPMFLVGLFRRIFNFILRVIRL